MGKRDGRVQVPAVLEIQATRRGGRFYLASLFQDFLLYGPLSTKEKCISGLHSVQEESEYLANLCAPSEREQLSRIDCSQKKRAR